MTDSSNGPQTAQNVTDANAQLGQLRELLFGQEKDQLERIRQQLDDSEVSVKDVSRVLAEAVRARNSQDDSLGQALGPTIVEALHSSIKQEPRPLVEAIAPVMGPAIRRSILQTIRGMVQSLNRTLEHSLSTRGLKWRLEAFRTGKSFGEVVFLHTLVYQVEHLFLIHRETGLLLQHVGLESAEVQDTDLVSSMLTAIQDFVHDSFGGHDTLDTMRLQERTVCIESGSAAVLAIVIRGEAPEQLRTEIQETLEKVHIELRKELATFAGDATPFERSRPELERCLQVKFQESETAGLPLKAIALIGLASVAVLCALGYWGFLNMREQQRWDDYVQRLQAEPGIVVTTAEKRRGKYHVSGLYDPLARSPQSLLADTEFEPQDVMTKWESYHSSEPPLVVQRLERLLSPPPTVKLELEAGTLQMTGEATLDWIADAGKVALSVPGVTSVNADKLRDVDATWRHFLEKLYAEPGIIVTDSGKRDGQYFVTGLREPLARNPLEIQRECKLESVTVLQEWEAYQSSAPHFTLVRATRLLNPPPTVTIEIEQQLLKMTGAASHVWITRSVPLAHSVPGVVQLDTTQLIDLDAQRLAELTRDVQQYVVRFEGGASAVIDAKDDLQPLAESIKSLLSASVAAERQVEIRIVGHAAKRGSDEFQQELSQMRAEVVRTALATRGVPAERLTASAAGATQPARTGGTTEDLAANRRVTFEVTSESKP